jgi:hypothetical protein
MCWPITKILLDILFFLIRIFNTFNKILYIFGIYRIFINFWFAEVRFKIKYLLRNRLLYKLIFLHFII